MLNEPQFNRAAMSKTPYPMKLNVRDGHWRFFAEKQETVLC